MGLFRDSRDRRDLSLKVCWTLAVWLMTQQLRCDVNEADEAEQRRLERPAGSFDEVVVNQQQLTRCTDYARRARPSQSTSFCRVHVTVKISRFSQVEVTGRGATFI